ncbi:MAG: multidrug effflux MFS transporter [Alphaproteobacteria bacterium]
MKGHLAPDSRGVGALLVGLVAMMAISTDLYLPSLPSIARDFGVDVAAAQLTLSAFMLGIAAGQVVVGPLSDRLGRRPVLVGASACYALASVACALAPGIDALVASRVVQALGACAGGVVGRAVVRDVHGREGAARVLALIGSAMAIMPAIGPILGGFVEAWAGWRWNFALLAAFGAALSALAWAGLPETNARRDPRATDPLRMARNFATILSSREFLSFAAIASASYGGMFAFISGSSFVFVDGLGTRPEAYGFHFALVVAGYFAGTQLAAWLTPRRGIEAMLRLAGLVMLAGGGAMLACAASGAVLSSGLAAPAIGASMALYCVGFGICSPNAAAGAIAPFPALAGTAASALGVLQTGSAALVGALVGHLHDGTPLPMAATIAAMALAATISFRLLNSRD